MEREIIFRGKRIESGEWVEGDLISNAFTTVIDGLKCCYILDYKKIEYQDLNDVFEMLDEFEVDPETVGQYTGLKDSTGKRIFEGDIVHYKNSIEQAKGLVEFEGCRFHFEWIDIAEPDGALYFFQCEKELEIIGNRFDNPELLEVQ